MAGVFVGMAGPACRPENQHTSGPWMAGVVEHLATLTGSRDRDVLDVTLVTALKDLLHPEVVAIYRCVGEEGSQRWLTRAHLTPDDAAATANPLWAEVDELPLLESAPDRLACMRCNEVIVVSSLPGQLAHTYLPLDAEHGAVGVLEIQTRSPLNEETLRTTGAVLRVYRNFQGLLDYSERDTLTGLLNRKTFDDCFLRLMAQVSAAEYAVTLPQDRRHGSATAVWLGVIDIDHFKRVNDTHGHLIGDEVLLLLGRLLRSSFRYYDHLFRFGGEEFVVLIRCGGAADALGAFERLRRNVERYAFPKVGQVHVSVGVAQLRSGDTPTACFERADKALYFAKQHGRNQVQDFTALVAQGQLVEESRNSDVEFF
jgi:diguanylate cyclase (GGDEF)-like protein